MNVAQLEDLVSQLRSGKEADCDLNRTAPKEIFLQVSDDEEDFKKPFPKPLSEEMTWSPGPVVVCEVRYVRADLAIQPAIPEGMVLENPPVPTLGAYVVFDGDVPQYCSFFPEACHEHINDAINEWDIEGAGQWRVVRMIAAAGEKP